MRRTRSVSLAVGLGVIVALACAPAAPARASCGAASARTLAANRQIRIYETKAESVYACLKSSGRSRKLGPHPEGGGALVKHPFALATPWAGAAEFRQTGQDTGRVYAVALNVRTGRAKECLISDGIAPSFPRVKRLTLSRTGKLHWVAVVRKERIAGSC
jgi:hypothetical protein